MVTYSINKEDDYGAFLSDEAKKKSENGKNKQKVKFRIIVNSIEELDVELLSLYYLICSKYNDKYHFLLEIYFKWDYKPNDVSVFRLRTYCDFVENATNLQASTSAQVIYKNRVVFNLKNLVGGGRKNLENQVINTRRMMPLMVVTEDSYLFLKKKIDFITWETIRKFDNKKTQNTYENLIKGLLNNLLFRQANFNKSLYSLRKEMFESEAFFKLVEGLPIIAIIIFGMFDFAYRDEALEDYKNEIQQLSDKKTIILKKEDFLYEFQNQQSDYKYVAHLKTCDHNYDNKTLWESYKNKTIHPFVVKELFEAVSISEGILQLLENIILHADRLSNNKIGVFSVYMRNKERDKTVLEGKYNEYKEQFANENQGKKYYFEICITDLSGTNIPKQFIKNNKEYLDKRGEDIMKICLKDFFDPAKEKRKFWRDFYDDSDRAIKHYGLQIFDSIISSRNGLFIVDSGTESFCNLQIKDKSNFIWGTRYQILCPVNENNYDGQLTNDHLFRFEELRTLPTIISYQPDEDEVDNDQEIINIYENIKATGWTGGQLLRIDMGKIRNTEIFIKGLLKYIYDVSKSEEVSYGKILLIALLNCEPYQILEIVRIISLYYDKQGNNTRMSYAQIYIRGKRSGEEILFFGEKLSDVIQNITKSACIRGIMYENIDTINYLLKREKENE